MKHIIFSCLGLLLLVAFFSNYPAAQEITIVTSEFAPFNYVDNGESKGFCTEIVQEILKRNGIQAAIKTYPWSRAYETALRKKNTLIYTIARIPDREALFQWVGVIVSGKTYLFSFNYNKILLKSLDEAKIYRIGAVRNGIRARHLLSKGIELLDLVKDSRTNAVKLINGRIDLWVEDEMSAFYTVKQMGYVPEEVLFKSLALDLELDGYLAFSLNTDQKLVGQFKDTLSDLIKDGTYQKIITSYK